MSKLSKVISLFLAVSLLLSPAISGTTAKAAQTPSVGTTYYVSSARGNDANDGKSPSTAWKSIDKINATTFQPGDTILFKAKDEWHGQIWFKGQGTAEHPIKVDMYGDVAVGDEVNYPAIHGDGVERKQGSTGTIMLVNTPYWEVRHLQITNDDDFTVDNYDNVYDPVTRLCTNLRDGIMVLLNSDKLPAGTDDFVMEHVYLEENYIHNVDSVGYWTNGRGNFSPDLNYNDALFSGGIMVFIVGSAKPNMTYNDVRVANNTLDKVDFLGIGTFDFSDHDYMQKNTVTLNHMMKNVYIGHNYLHSIGQGVIDACDMEGGVVEYNVGDVWGLRYAAECAGIYPWRSNNTVLSHNIVSNGPESFPKTTGDGTAWDIDSGLYNITYEYNYSYKNPMGTVSYLGRNYNTIYRYNIADRDQSYFIKWGWFGRDYTDLYFMNNLAYFDSTSLTAPGTGENASRVYRFTGASTSISSYFQVINVYFINNLFYDYGNGDPTQTNNNFSHYFFQGRSSSANNSYGTAIFQNNYFYEANRPGAYPANTYAPWQVNTAINTGNFYHGMAGPGVPLAEPKLVGLTPTFNENPPLNKPMNLSDPFWANFKLQADSPLIDAGKFVRQIGPVDFYGNELYYGSAPDIGVHEYTEGKTRTIPDYSEAPRSNLAYGKSITTQYANQISYTLNDGNMENSEDSIHYNWHTPNTDPQYIEIDFGAPTTFNNVRLYEWITNPPAWTSSTAYTTVKRPHLQYYNYEYWDGSKWVAFYDATPDVDRTAASTVPNTYLSDTFAPVTASKLRINLLKMDDLVVLRELEVYNLDGNPPASVPVQANLALASAAVPSAGNLFDGDASTYYTGQAGNQSVSITLPAESTFNRISIKELTDSVTSYRLQANVDGEWVTLATGSNIGKVNTNLFDAVKAQGLRFDYTATSAPDFASFGVYLVKSLAPEKDFASELLARYTFEDVSGGQVKSILNPTNNTTGGAIGSAGSYGLKFVEDPDRGKVAYFGGGGLDNSDYLRVSGAKLDFTTGSAISMWIKPDPAFMYGWVATNAAVPMTLFSKGVNATESYSATMFANGLTGAFQSPLGFQRDGSTARGPRWVPVSAGSLDNDYYVQTGEWNHVVFTWDGYYYSAYVNGQRVLHTRVKDPYTDVPKAFSTVPAEPLYFGNQRVTASGAVNKNPYFGYMDDIRIYSDALSYNQVRQLYAEGDIPQVLTGITINTNQVRKVYDLNEGLDLTGLTVKANYQDGTAKTITGYTTDPANGAILSEEGGKTVTVTYIEGDATYTASFDITVISSSTLEIASLPTTINYVVGDALDLSGLMVKANYKDGYSEVLLNSEYETSPEDGSVLSEPGIQSISVSRTESGVTQNASFVVMVWENEIPAQTTFAAITMSRLPNKTTYWEGETLDMSGSVVTAVYSDNSSSVITDSEYTVLPALDTPLTTANTQVTVSYTVDGRTKTVSFPITVRKVVHVAYYADDRTSGDVPVDSTDYLNGQTVTVPGSALERTGYTFDGWTIGEDGTTVYNEGDTFQLGASDVGLYAKWTPLIFHVRYYANDKTVGDVPVDSTGYLNGQAVTVKGSGNLGRGGYTFDGWVIGENGSTVYKEGDTLQIDLSDVDLYAKWTHIDTPTSPNTGGGSAPAAPAKPQTTISLNGTDFNPATIDTSKPSFTLNVPATSNTAYISIPVSLLNDMAGKNKTFDLNVQSPIGSYTVPANLSGVISDLSGILAGSGLKAEDVSIKINIKDESKNTGLQASIANNLPSGKVLGGPVDFSMVIVNTKTGAAIKEVKSFTGYVVRRIPIPDGIDSAAQLSAFRSDSVTGALEFVPHRLVRENGKLFMEIKSKSNSVYVAAQNNVTFTDVASGYWGAPFINKAASKGLVYGMGNNKYEPERKLTRAEFVTMVGNALDLPDAAAGTKTYSDVKDPAQWYYAAITKARSAGLLNSFNEDAFKVNQAITREEMATILAAALTSEKAVSGTEAVDLKKFKDFDKMDTEKLASIELVNRLQVMAGVSTTIFDPKGIVTRAQAATVQLQLLKALGLIDA